MSPTSSPSKTTTLILAANWASMSALIFAASAVFSLSAVSGALIEAVDCCWDNCFNSASFIFNSSETISLNTQRKKNILDKPLFYSCMSNEYATKGEEYLHRETS